MDFSALLNDPSFQFGANLLTNRQPDSMAQSFGLLQKLQEQKLREKQFSQLQNYQQAEKEHMTAQEKVAQSQFERQQMLAEAQLKHQKEQDERNDNFMRQAAGLLGGPKYVPPAPTGQEPQASGPVGKYGTPSALLDNLRQTESGGNPLAVNPDTKAMGAYQFLPSTVQMLKQQGINFDPFNHDQSRDAADKYIQQLMGQNGGDMNKALAAYGGFKTKDPSSYIRKVMSGVTPSAPAAATPADAPSGMDVAKLGAFGALGGMKGGSTLVELGKMMQPQNVPAGGYQRTPDGQMTFVPDPYRERQLNNDTQRVADEQAKTKMALEEKRIKAANERANAETSVTNIVGGMQRMGDNIDALLAHPGLGLNTGWAGALGVPKVPGTAAHDASVLLDSLKSKLVVNTMTDLKSASKTGSTGFGQLSEKEGMRLETYLQNLDRAQTLPAMKKALTDLKQFSTNSAKTYQQKFQSTYGAAQPAPAAAPALPNGWKVVQ